MRKNSREILLVAFIHLALAFVVSFPLAANFNSGIPYAHRVDPGWETVYMQQGDHLQFFYTLTLFGDYVKNDTGPFFTDPYTFRTAETERYFAPRELPLSIVHFLMSPLGNVLVYNLLTVLSFVACGIGVFLLAGRHVKSFGARLFASVVYSVFPFRMAQLFGGHPNGFLIFLIPLMVYGYERWFDDKKLKYMVLAAVCLVWMTMEELHLGYFSALFTVAFVAYKGAGLLLEGGNRKKLESAKKFLGASLGVAIAWMFAGGYIAYLRNVVFKIADVAEGRELWEIGIYAPRLADFVRRGSMDAEKLIYPGIISLAAAAFAFVRKKGEIFPRGKKISLWFYGFILIITAILSLGPNLRGVPLYSFFYNYVPFFHYPRSTARIFVFTMLALSVLGAYGFETLRGMIKSKPLAKTLAPCLILLLLIDFQSFRSIGVSTVTGGNSVYEYVSEQEEPGYLLEIPLWPGDSSWSSIYLYYNTIYRLPMVNGYSPFVAREYIEGVFWPLASINMGVISSSQHRRLREIGVKYIILHEEAYPAVVSPFPFRLAVKNMKNNPFVEFIKQDRSLYLFKVRSEPEEAPGVVYSEASKMGVFYEAEHLYSRLGSVVHDEDASGGMARFAGSRDAAAEFLVFGPYQLFPPGEYRMIFRLKGEPEEPDEVFARLDITGDEGRKTFAEKILSGGDVSAEGYSDYEIMFSIDELEILEFRVRWFGNGRIWADYVHLMFQGESDPVYSYSASEMFNSRGDYGHGAAGMHPPHNILYGGRRRYEEGDYTAVFRVMASELADDRIAVLRVLQAGRGAPFAEVPLTGLHFQEEREFIDIDVPFSLEKDEVLVFEVFYTGITDVWAEGIRIEPREGNASAAPPREEPDLAKLAPGILRYKYSAPGFTGMLSHSVQARPSGGLSPGSSYIWEGYIQADGGEHTVGVLAEGASVISIDGEEILNSGAVGPIKYAQAGAGVDEGLRHVLIRHTASGRDGLFRLYWREPGSESPVPLPVRKSFFNYLPGDAPN